MKKLTLAVMAGLLVSAPLVVMADGASIAKDECAACHGDEGNSSNEKVPSIAGFSKDGLVEMLMAYKAGDRQGDKYKPENGDETDMNAVTKEMASEDIEAVAEFFSSKSFSPANQSADAALATSGATIHEESCEKCHSDGGKSSEDDTAILAGQWKSYLEGEFAKFGEDKRDMPKKMEKKFSALSADDKKALLEYYASQK